jgi:hypothetical protein
MRIAALSPLLRRRDGGYPSDMSQTALASHALLAMAVLVVLLLRLAGS